MYRVGGCSMAATPYVPSESGGYWHAMPMFSADANRTFKGEDDCTKHKFAHGALSPGLMVRCCALPCVDALPEHVRAMVDFMLLPYFGRALPDGGT